MEDDPARIPKTLELLETIWSLYPDMRLGQLVCNIADWAEVRPWDLEDDTLIAEILEHLRQAPRAIEVGIKVGQWDRCLSPTNKPQAATDRAESESPPMDWLPGFFERTAGAWQGPLVREDQGEYEIREPLE